MHALPGGMHGVGGEEEEVDIGLHFPQPAGFGVVVTHSKPPSQANLGQHASGSSHSSQGGGGGVEDESPPTPCILEFLKCSIFLL